MIISSNNIPKNTNQINDVSKNNFSTKNETLSNNKNSNTKDTLSVSNVASFLTKGTDYKDNEWSQYWDDSIQMYSLIDETGQYKDKFEKLAKEFLQLLLPPHPNEEQLLRSVKYPSEEIFTSDELNRWKTPAGRERLSELKQEMDKILLSSIRVDSNKRY